MSSHTRSSAIGVWGGGLMILSAQVGRGAQSLKYIYTVTAAFLTLTLNTHTTLRVLYKGPWIRVFLNALVR
ncbi:hypothetical protein T492DRAFT_994812 [Pavlovales sp. CCMP2436]|nr:hypothetical protein T492DRAFT_994812 [Pavlovales sp. CCMP2436]